MVRRGEARGLCSPGYSPLFVDPCIASSCPRRFDGPPTTKAEVFVLAEMREIELLRTMPSYEAEHDVTHLSAPERARASPVAAAFMLRPVRSTSD